MLGKVKIAILVVFASISCVAVAAPKNLQIFISEIKADKTEHKRGDKIYFSVTEYPSKGDPRITRMPAYPLHILTKDLAQMHDVILWQGLLDNKESLLLIITLLEQKLPLIQADDAMGSVQVLLKNDNGKINAEWGQPHFKDQPKVEQKGKENPTYLLFGNNSEYTVAFKLNTGLPRPARGFPFSMPVEASPGLKSKQ